MNNNCVLSINQVSFGKTRYIKPMIKSTPFAELKLGKKINEGIQASVYKLQGFNSLVVKTNKFDPQSLSWDVNSFTHKLLSSEDNRAVVMEKISGKPLHGKGWVMGDTPFVTVYKNTLREMLSAPEEAYVFYMKKVSELRKNGYQIDSVNPNNVLYDKKNKRFNIVDISKTDSDITQLKLEDFSPFWDGVRLLNIYDKANAVSKYQISKLVKKLMTKILSIGQKHGYHIEVEPFNKYSYQPPAICFFYDKSERLDKCLKDPRFRETYLLRIDD